MDSNDDTMDPNDDATDPNGTTDPDDDATNSNDDARDPNGSTDPDDSGRGALDGVDRARAWLAAVLGGATLLIVGALVFPRRVYDGFVWRYFWGPVVADAHGAACAVRSGGTTELLYDAEACATASGFVAEPGYTLVSEIGYIVLLLVGLSGVLILLDRLALPVDRRLFFALVPFMLFGGALRTVEDASVSLPAGAPGTIPFPASALIISPFIYVTVAAVTLAALLASEWVARRGRDDPHRLLAGIGTTVLLLSIGYLGALAATTEEVTFYPLFAAAVVVLTAATVSVTWRAIRRFAPWLNRGTGKIGYVVLWAHALDGVANVLALDWAVALGLPATLVPKHPANRAIIAVAEAALPESAQAVIGTAWPFLLVKIAAVVFVLWLFDEEIFESDRQYAILLLVAIVAVGMGPGTRDALRATFGV